jgi:LysR family transcriptional regulator of beta-lactamase
MVDAALQGAGVALAPPLMFQRQLIEGSLVQPFAAQMSKGSYWLTQLKSRATTPAMKAFRNWIAKLAKMPR